MPATRPNVTVVLSPREAEAVLSMLGLVEASDEWWETVSTNEAKAGERALYKFRAAHKAATS